LLTLADQGVFTLTNFGLNLLLARWLLPDEYGAFTIAFALFFLVGAFHLAVLIEPMLIFGSCTSDEQLSAYLNAVLYWHWNFALVTGFLLVSVGAFCRFNGPAALASSLTALAVAGPFILLLWLLRGMCYVRSENIFLAVWGGGLYLALMGISLTYLFWRGWLSAASGISTMGGVSGVVGVWLATRLGVHWRGDSDEHIRHGILTQHLRYGRWSAAMYVSAWIPENLSYFLLSCWSGLGTSAALRALMNFLMPLLRMQAALVPLLLTTIARTWTSVQAHSIRLLLYALTSGALVYWIGLGVFHHSLIGWVYDGQYQEHGVFLWFLGLVPLSGGVSTVFSAILRARGRPDVVCWVYAMAALLMMTVGTGLVAAWGIAGAIWGMGLAGVTTALLMWREARQVGWVTTKGRT
jgi:O-antigen/teichoic acid export membrane protein